MRVEYFKVKGDVRKFDAKTGKFIISVSYETAPPETTERILGVAEAFGLGIDSGRRFVLYDNFRVAIGPGDIVYITGESGSGKSVLLRELEKDIRSGTSWTCIDIDEIKPAIGKPIVETVGSSLEEALELLSLVGLNDAYLFLRNYEHLSDGQKYRYKIAKMIESGAQFWIADEFCSTLDRDTAKIVAFNLQKIARKLGRAVIVATTHTDLFEDLSPSIHIHKRFGREVTVKYYPSQPTKECSLVKEMRVEEGTYEDWKKLAYFHYRSHRIANVRKIFRLMRGDELCGVIVYSYPPPTCFGRRLVLPKISVRDLNENLSTISRVVVHPKYRSIGLGQKIVRETLPLVGTPYVEMVAVMAKYNPFAEKAGMKKIVESKPDERLVKIISRLKEMGFNTHLLACRKYVLNKIRELDEGSIKVIKEEFMDFPHPRFIRILKPDKNFLSKRAYVEEVKSASAEKLARLIEVCSILSQTKVYLFWQRD
ncbi:MAG: ABC transporter ATP-binding protein [Candidatus Bathyarchaeia archaeon]